MFTLSLSSPSASLEAAGGKGASLARLSRLGLPVPPAFIVTTDAYRAYISANHLVSLISTAIADLNADDPAQLDEASARIRSAFSNGSLPPEITGEIVQAWQSLSAQPISVAVRSSATTEDLPDLSFAGQQDTFLNIIGETQLLKAVVDCWSSLWTARAIGYRLRNHIPHDQASLAVVVQQMIPSEVSGVLFTANPLTGLHSESVIDATFGLGEALVSGQVQPDHFVVDSASGEVGSMTPGTKKTLTRGKEGGGVESIQAQSTNQPTLTAEQVSRLVAFGQHIQKEYGAPQDIEWALTGGDLFILQSRPITSLFPTPSVSYDPLLVWFSFGAFQGMIGPMTPLGQEAIQRVVLGVGNKVGVKINFDTQDFFASSGERVWVRISDLIRNPIGSRAMAGFLEIGEPGTANILRQLTSDPRLGAGKGHLKFSTLRRVLGFMLPALREIPLSISHPERSRTRFDAHLEAYLQTVQIPAGADRFERLTNFATFMAGQGGLAEALPVVMRFFIPMMAPSLMGLNLLSHLLPEHGSGRNGIAMSVLEVMRGLPHNVTTEMDLALWQTVSVIRADQVSEQAFGSTPAGSLAAQYLAGSLPTAAQSAIRSFMDQYGMRGPGEIDLGQPRWREDPTPVMQVLQSYLQIEAEFAPDRVFEHNARAAGEAVERLAAEVRGQHGGRFKEKLFRAAVRRVRVLFGARESPKFVAVRAMGRVRATLLEIGREFADVGTIDRPDDLFYLHVAELEAMARRESRDWQALVTARRQAYARELRRRQVPRVLVSDGRTFYEGVGAATDGAQTITGSPVSPGVVEGIVHVVLDPAGARLVPGEILVCPGTDPAWTPLFMAAGGLVMEVGGMMTHGSVVAREYGIPAVVGVDQATLRLQDGQRIQVDGTTGRITLL